MENNSSLPVIVGLLGYADDAAALAPVFAEFERTFGASAPLRFVQVAAPGQIVLRDPAAATITSLALATPGTPGTPGPSNASNASNAITLDDAGAASHRDEAARTAAYLLHNCHFVLLHATPASLLPVEAALIAQTDGHCFDQAGVRSGLRSLLEYPEACPVLRLHAGGQPVLQILDSGADAEAAEEEASEAEPAAPVHGALRWFDYAPRASLLRRVWATLNGNPPSTFRAAAGAPALTTLQAAEPAARRWRECVEAIHRQAEFNREEDCIPDAYQGERFGYSAAGPEAGIAPMFRIFCKADRLATRYQMRWQVLRFTTLKNLDPKTDSRKRDPDRKYFSFLYLGAFSALLLAFSTEFGDTFGGWGGPVASFVYIGVLLVCLLRFHNARRLRLEQKHQDYRFIGEVLAIAIYWAQAGIAHSASDHFPSGLRTDVRWVRRAVQVARLLCDLGTATPQSPVAVAQCWISNDSGQLTYHNQTVRERRHRAMNNLRRKRKIWGVVFLSMIALLLGLSFLQAGELRHAGGQGSALAEAPHGAVAAEPARHAEAVASPEHGEEGGHEWVHHAVIVLMAFSGVVFALLGEAIEGYAIEQELTRSEALVLVYRRCLRELDNPLSEADQRRLLADVGSIVIEAEANWLVLHRDRPMQPVKGG